MSPSTSDSPAQNFAWRFETAFARLQVAVLGACAREAEWPTRIAAAIRVALRFAAADPDSARALTVDALAQGKEGARRQQRAIKHFGELLHAAAPGDTSCPAIIAEGMVGSIFWLVADRIYAGDGEGFSDLAPDLIELTLLPYIGAEDAARLAKASA